MENWRLYQIFEIVPYSPGYISPFVFARNENEAVLKFWEREKRMKW